MKMAEKKTLKDYYKKIGSYEEYAGGGTPMTKGEKIDKVVDTPEEADAYKENNPNAIVRVRQPRDEDGKFTYNSANAKPLRYEQRPTTTVPPFLRDLKVTFAKKTGTMSFVINEKRFVASQFKTSQEFIDAHKKYLGDEGFKDIGKVDDTVKGKGGAAVKEKDMVSIFDSQAFMDAYNKRENKGKDTSFATKTDADTTTKNTGNDSGSSDNKLDANLAKSNPQAFMKNHSKDLQEISDMAAKKGYRINVDDIVKGVAKGDITDFESLKDFIKGLK